MVKATARKPQATTATASGRPAQKIIDVEEVTPGAVDTNSAEALADALDAGVPVPGSDEAIAAEIAQSAGNDTPQGAALAKRVGGGLPAVGNYDEVSGGGVVGEFDQSDLKLPQLKIVNGSGELSQRFNQGTLIYADEVLWLPPNPDAKVAGPVMHFVPLQISKQFRENLTPEDVEEGLMPRIVNSRAEAEELTGEGTTQWVNNEKPRWSPSARCVLLLQEFEGCEHPGFCNPLDGKNWALAVYYASGVGYNESAKQIFNAAQISLKDKGRIVLHKKVWTWEVTKKKAGKFTIFVPKLRLTRDETGPDVREMAAMVNGKGTTDKEN